MSNTQKKNKQINLPLTEFLINEIYRISKSDYLELTGRFQKNYVYFPDPGESEITGKSPGKIFRERFIPENDIYSLPEAHRKNLSNIKNKFLYKYLRLLGVPDPSHAGMFPGEEVTTENILLLKEKTVFQPKYLKTLANQAPDLIGPGALLIWVNSSDLTAKDSFRDVITQKISLADSTIESPPRSDYQIVEYLQKRKITIVADFTSREISHPGEFELIRRLIYLVRKSDKFRFFLISTDADELNFKTTPEDAEKDAMNDSEEIILPQKTKKHYLIRVVALSLLLLIPGSIYLYSVVTKHRTVIKTFHYGDLPARDSFKAGVQFIWLDSSQYPVHYGAGSYFASHELEYKPENVKYLLPVAGGYKAMPEIIHISELEKPEISINFYRKLNFNDFFTENILRPSAQRWYVFKLEKPSNVLFMVKAITPNFSPQTAIYRDPNGLKRVTGSSNFSGKSSVDSTYGYLDPGEYYLKVRGYDSLTGKFTVEGIILKE
ncbi:MAG: hypothetical protein L6Q59_13535 [Ignavibacteriaceae bacterium]|nr:hypothetical protein [Ignavibacteriaceae bacterium]